MKASLRGLPRLAAALGGLVLAAGAAAQPFVISELGDPELPAQPLETDGFASLGEVAVFSSFGTLGREPWRTDGTVEGTWPLVDFCPGRCGSGVEPLGLLDGRLFFTAQPFGGDRWLLRTDGTLEGTVPLDGPFREIQWLGVSGGRALLLVSRPDRGFENGGEWLMAWSTDAVEPTMELRHDTLNPAAVESGGRVWVTGKGLWVSDGTEAGTRQVSNRSCNGPVAVAGGVTCWSGAELSFHAGGPSSQRLAALDVQFVGVESAVADGRGRAVYVIAAPGVAGDQLWVTDGTVSGSRRLDAPLDVGEIGAHDGRLYFAARDNAGVEPWTTEGRPGDSRRLADLCPGACSSSPRAFTSSGRGVLFYTLENDGPVLWHADGSRRAPRRLVTSSSGRNGSVLRAVEHRGDLYVEFDTGLFRVEPDLDVHEIVPIEHFYSLGQPFAVAGDIVVFPKGDLLWRTDGTPAGTSSLSKGGTPFASPGPEPRRELIAHRGGVCVEAHGFWCGDDAGLAERGSGGLALEAALYSAGDVLFALDRTQVIALRDAGPQPVFSGQVEHGQAAVLGDELFFFGSSGFQSSPALWRSDGTVEGTRLVTGPLGGASGLLVLDDVLVFAAGGFAHKGLWSSDGTLEGTIPLPAELPGFAPVRTASFRGAAWFAEEGQLWRSDGTVAGTFPTIDLDLFFSRDDWTPIATRDHLFLAGGFDPKLWVTDGGTPLVELLELGRSFEREQVAVAGNRLFFVADHPDVGKELWVSDGTPGGTRALDLFPGPFGSSPRHLAAVSDLIVFAAHDFAHGREVWVSDGTLAGSRRVTDVAPGWVSSEPHDFLRVGDHLYFLADDGVSGTEVWAVEWGSVLAGGACQPADTRLCLGGGRFAVTVQWRDHINGGEGRGHAVPLPGSDQTGTFWFFHPDNVELIVKALDGTPVNGHHWLFYGALSTVEYWIDVVDTATGSARRYHNPPGEQCGRGDTTAFAGSAAAPSIRAGTGAAAVAPVTACAGEHALCLLGGSLAVEVDWHDPRSGDRGRGVPIAGSDNTGTFWFFDAANVELVVKALDGTTVNGHRWVFYGGLSDVEYEIRVTETATGAVRTYRNPFGEICGGADTAAF